RSLRVSWVVADDRIKHYSDVGDTAPDRSADVLGAGERNYPGAAGQSLCPPDSHQAVMRRWDANRATGVAAHADSREIGGDGSAGPAAGPSGIAVECVGVPGLTEQRADRDDAAGEFVHI